MNPVINSELMSCGYPQCSDSKSRPDTEIQMHCSNSGAMDNGHRLSRLKRTRYCSCLSQQLFCATKYSRLFIFAKMYFDTLHLVLFYPIFFFYNERCITVLAHFGVCFFEGERGHLLCYDNLCFAPVYP